MNAPRQHPERLYGQGSAHRARSRKLPAVILVGVLAAACALDVPPAPAPSPLPPTSAPPVPFVLPTLLPTPTLPSPPTPSAIPLPPLEAGDIVLSDSFDELIGWEYSPKGIGDLSVIRGRLSLAVRITGGVLVALNSTELPADFYAEVAARPELCQPEDEFGLVFRAGGFGEHYRFTLNCSGEARLTRLHSGTQSALIPFQATHSALPGVGQENRLGVLARQDSFLLVLNGEAVFNARDPAFGSGQIGLVVSARKGPQTTVTFDNLVVRSLATAPTPLATASPTPQP